MILENSKKPSIDFPILLISMKVNGEKKKNE